MAEASTWLEMTGGDNFREAMICLAPGGRVVVYGIASRTPFQVPTERLISRGHGVIGFYLGLYFADRDLITSTLAELAGFVQAGHSRADTVTFALAEAAEAHRQLEGQVAEPYQVVVGGRHKRQPPFLTYERRRGGPLQLIEIGFDEVRKVRARHFLNGCNA